MPAPTTDGGRLALVVSAHAPLGGPIASALAQRSDLRVVLVGEGVAQPGVELVSTGPEGDLTAAVGGLVADSGPVDVLVEIPSRLLPGAAEADDAGSRVGSGELDGIVDRLDLIVPAMAAAGRGRVVFVAEASGIPGREWDDRRASVMWGLVGVARARSRELAAEGITFNVVRVGLVATPELEAARASDEAIDAAVSAAVAATPLRRPVTTDEVSATVTFLASEAASYITGAILPVDGGLTMGLGS